MKSWMIAGSMVAVALSGVGCFEPRNEEDPNPRPPARPGIEGTLKTFADAKELAAYLAQVKQDADQGSDGMTGSPGSEVASSPSTENEEITNNQESGVDEGGLVKNYRDFLVTLRRGRLAVVRVGPEGDLETITHADVTPQGLGSDVWYDELLIHGNQALVIGYRYGVIPFGKQRRGATELNFFEISDAGGLSRTQTIFIESSDYYSANNYAGRVVNGKLVLYMPYDLWFLSDDDDNLTLPRIFRHEGNGELASLGELFDATEVFRPVRETASPTLHSVLVCDITDPRSFDCDGQVIVASWFRELYVSQQRAYFWIAGEWSWEDDEGLPNQLFAVELDGDGVGVVEVDGFPVDQFSFSETEMALEVLATSYDETRCGGGGPRSDGRETTLIRVPFGRFGDGVTELPDEDYTCLPDNGFAYVNRFGETHLAYATSGGVTVVDRETDKVTQIELPFTPQRIELAGDRMVLFGWRWTAWDCVWECKQSAQLSVALLELAPSPTIGSTLGLEGTFEGEWRSHGYAFHEGETFDLFGLATFNLDTGEEKVSFFRIGEGGDLAIAGELVPDSSLDGGEACEASCVDWYGNSRPIFLGDQILGLVGDQILSGSFDEMASLLTAGAVNIFTEGSVVD